jgi:catechol 2,3-dioxygenase-like lactoylglutathione lyase family enzyme
MPTVSVRYIVNNVDEAIPFYCDLLGFEEVMHPAPPFAMLRRGDLRLLLSQPGGGPGGGQAGGSPSPGGWNRFAVEVDDLDAFLEPLRAAGVRFRGDVAEGIGGRQVIAEDPSGNPIELFQPTQDVARLDPTG